MIHTPITADTRLRDAVDALQRRADARKGKPGYLALLERLTTARTALLAAELDM